MIEAQERLENVDVDSRSDSSYVDGPMEVGYWIWIANMKKQ